MAYVGPLETAPRWLQLDSKLVSEQVNARWACRTPDLRPFLEEAWRKVRGMESNGREFAVEHISREYNKHADALANRAVDTRSYSTGSPRIPLMD